MSRTSPSLTRACCAGLGARFAEDEADVEERVGLGTAKRLPCPQLPHVTVSSSPVMLKRIEVKHLTLGMYLHEFCGSWMEAVDDLRADLAQAMHQAFGAA